jgi:hypothetical protein
MYKTLPNPEVDILLGKAREIDGPYQIVAALCHVDCYHNKL